ncbi:MAG: hypothetical protein Q8O84_04360 [Nanoarchaeota archaeon]|nr:hypothetical protein [Nanoarchaeota archaeon]
MENKLEQISIKNGSFINSKKERIKNFIYIGQSSFESTKKFNRSALYESMERVKMGNKDFNAFLIEEPKANSGRLFGLIQSKIFKYYFKLYKI